MANLEEIRGLASQVVARYLGEVGVDLTDATIKVAQAHALGHEDIRQLVGRVNRDVVVNMNQKIAARQLPMGSTYPSVDPSTVLTQVRQVALAPNELRASPPPLPPPSALYAPLVKQVKDDVAPAWSPSAADIQTQPLLIHSTEKPDVIKEVAETAAQRSKELMQDLAALNTKFHSLVEGLDRMIGQQLAQRTPPIVMKQAFLMCPSARAVLDNKIAELKAPDRPALGEFVVEQSHPLMKMARDLEDVQAKIIATNEAIENARALQKIALARQHELVMKYRSK